MDGLPLNDVIRQLREELSSAAEQSSTSNLHFPVQTVTVELKVAVTKVKEGKAGFKVPFVGVELGGSLAATNEVLQTITLELGSPVDNAGNPIKVGRSAGVKPS